MLLAAKTATDAMTFNNLKDMPITQHLLALLPMFFFALWMFMMAVSAISTFDKETKQPQAHPFLRIVIYATIPLIIAVTARNLFVMWVNHATHDMSFSAFLAFLGPFMLVSMFLMGLEGRAVGIMFAQIIKQWHIFKELMNNGKNDHD